MRFYPNESNKKVNSNYIPPASVKQRLVDANKLEESVKITDKPAWMVVRDAPTVYVKEGVYGKWDDNGNCSACGKNIYNDIDADFWSCYQPPYCPNCGADMRGVHT